ncbi:MAG: YidC/Oxa1 family insertase periplasmic-domain containing protein, partial [Betaproteobacteria bacterium]
VRGYTEPQAVALLAAGGLQQIAPGKIAAAGQPLGSVRWVGVESHYFAALFVAPGGAAEAQVRPATLPTHGDDKPVTEAVALIDASASEPVQLFVGAKDHQQLAKLGHQLERVVQVGDWIGPIVIALMGLLRWVHVHVGNWGWSIVVLTVLINLVMAPFRHYSIVNGLKMAKLSPEMKAIQERYRKVPLMDPRRQQMQEEIAALYARHGMSMTSQMAVGCLPLLLTMPFLFAFYRVLSVAVELRGAPFLWIADLAQKDPLFVTPVLMGVSMFAMQKMTPSAMDPAQQRIMMLMPLMLAGMFLWAPAGLNLYWLTSNVWSLLQQWAEMTLLRKQPAKAARERRTK